MLATTGTWLRNLPWASSRPLQDSRGLWRCCASSATVVSADRLLVSQEEASMVTLVGRRVLRALASCSVQGTFAKQR
jgi:hypothetical protein